MCYLPYMVSLLLHGHSSEVVGYVEVPWVCKVCSRHIILALNILELYPSSMMSRCNLLTRGESCREPALCVNYPPPVV